MSTHPPSEHAPRPARDLPVEEAIPVDVLRQIEKVARWRGALNLRTARCLVTQFDTRKRFGVNAPRLLDHLTRAAATEDQSEAAEMAQGPGEREPTPAALQNHRQRQNTIAEILDSVFGRMKECNTDLWERRAWLMLVGMVYDRLASQELNIPTEELVSLSKILSPNRRSPLRPGQETPAYDTAGRSPTDSAPGGEPTLPPGLAQLVRQVYGTDLPASPQPDPQSPAPEGCSRGLGSGCGIPSRDREGAGVVFRAASDCP